MKTEKIDIWKFFKPQKTIEQCEKTKRGHSFIKFGRTDFKCLFCGKEIPRRF